MIFRTFIILCCIIIFEKSKAQQNSGIEDTIRILFYNTENFFDPFRDTIKEKEQEVSSGPLGWNREKFTTKVNHIAKVILAAGLPFPPAIVGLAEIENKYVLNQLTRQSPLKTYEYGIIHEESPDPRGIDVALLYRKNVFQPVWHKALRIVFPFDTNGRTRDILYVKGVVFSCDTVHIFINHWPSNYGGAATSGIRRNYVAHFLKSITDSIIHHVENPAIIITGDFNENPEDENMETLCKEGNLQNLMMGMLKNSGSHKFHGQWSLLDQFVVSSGLYQGISGLQVKNAGIFSEKFLWREDAAYTGWKPFRTFTGPVYEGGFSDHLPVWLDLYRNFTE